MQSDIPVQASAPRLYSLDALRGLDMLCIIGLDALIQSLAHTFPDNSVFSWLATQFTHVSWEGCHLYDLVFPLFVFLSGISLAYSLKRRLQEGKNRGRLTLEIFKRSALLIFIGMVMNGLMSFHFAEIRYSSVLGLIGIAYALGGVAIIWLQSARKIALCAILVLLSISGLQLIWGSFTPTGNINAHLDQALLPGILNNVTYDPEGIVCVVSASFLTMLGYLTGKLLQSSSIIPNKKLLILMGTGAALILIAQLVSPIYPIIKSMWTSSFNLMAGGIGLIVIAIFHQLIDRKGWRKPIAPLQDIGFNALAIYVGQFFINFSSINQTLFGGFANLFPLYYSCITAISIILLKWLILNRMRAHHICIKIG
ncbi:MAG: DUF5009 domain-containing protein [Akkermansia sp.]